MARGKKIRKEEIYDNVVCTVDSWRRDYSLEIKHWEIPGLETDRPFRELDRVVVTGTVLRHETNRKRSRRTFQTVDLWIFPTHSPREKWRKDLEAIGHVWTEKGEQKKLFGSVHAPADVYYSLIPCLAINHFREFTFKVLNLRYTKGDIDHFSFDAVKDPD